jgi:hypothetical protein
MIRKSKPKQKNVILLKEFLKKIKNDLVHNSNARSGDKL